jgi:predicted dehydrogenase
MKTSKRMPLRAGIIGCGNIASRFSNDKKRGDVVTHAHAYTQSPDVRLVAASDLDQGRLKQFSTKWSVDHVYQDYNQMLAKERLDIVSICSPQQLHYAMCKDAIKHQVRAIFCEKPVVHSLKEVDELAKLVKSSKVVFAVNHSRRWDRFHQRIASFIKNDGLGKINSMDAYYAGGIANTGTHMVDLIEMLSGSQVHSVKALSKPSDADGRFQQTVNDPTIDVMLKLRSGINAYLHGVETPKLALFEIDMYGSEGRLRIENSGYEATLWKVQAHPRFKGYRGYVKKTHRFGKGNSKYFECAVSNIARSLRKGEVVRCDFGHGARTLETVVAIQDSLKQSGTEIELPQRNRLGSL